MHLEMAGGAFTPSCGEKKDCSADREAFDVFDFIEIRAAAADIPHPIKTQLHFLLGKADDLQNQLAHAQDQLEREHLSTLVPTFMYTSQPVFTYLESRARSRLSQQPAVPSTSSTASLCESLEQLVLNYATQGLLSVDESQPDSLSHLYIGQCQIDRLMVSVFRYHVAAPFLSGGGAQPNLYKRMRWNVERLSDNRFDPHHHHQQQQLEEEPEELQLEIGDDTEYFFMCYEDIPKGVAAGISGEEEEGLATGNLATRIWSIGRWGQTIPNPDTEDIFDWILCEVPRARYLKLISLGSEEPSVCHATDFLLGVLFPQQTGGKGDSPHSEL
ncbi:UPF0575 protein C19orf67 [Merluccius polli]|uniref:UPF0575 protein C19orf67 n=1 Tax=Merluccius polli TaxID=89951 RepID=A0AA47N2W4_MERPO|nr:UPF0575 protein C19orf67 [Merluccius polli]